MIWRTIRYRTLLILGLCIPLQAAGRQSERSVPAIDTIVIQIDNVFDDDEAASNFLARTMNRFRFPTRRYFVRARLLFRTGEAYDSARV